MPDTDAVADALFAEADAVGQAVRRVVSDGDADAVRRRIRAIARTAGVQIRTARMDDTVVVARLDAQLWNDDAATMRRKLSLPPDG